MPWKSGCPSGVRGGWNVCAVRVAAVKAKARNLYIPVAVYIGFGVKFLPVAASNVRMRSERFLLTALLVLFAGFGGTLYSSLKNNSVEPGDRVPRFSITTNDQRSISPQSFGGKLLIVNFWQSSCAPCVAEMPSLNRLQEKLQREGVVIVGINADEDKRAYESFLANRTIHFPTAFDPEAGITHSFGTFAFPETYVIKPGGRLAGKFVGAQEWDSETMTARLRSFL